ncbi:MAG TPA: hypothetical protein VK498_05110 [Ferruginibacter sp.]|nr:hypothetical protein [Ferruginibacter sp.]
MIELKRVCPECCADTLLVELVLQRGKPAHYNGITEAIDAVIKHKTNSFTIGLVDTDKFRREPPQMARFSEVVEDRLQDQGLVVVKMPDTNKHLIRLHPKFEHWIWKLADECAISPKDYQFDSIKALENATKTQQVFENKVFRKFVNEVIKCNPPAIQTLGIWLGKVFEY